MQLLYLYNLLARRRQHALPTECIPFHCRDVHVELIIIVVCLETFTLMK